MKLLPERLLLSGSACALVAAASLALPACSNTAHVSGGAGGSTSISGGSTGGYGNTLYQRVTGRYFHCHPDGVCHGVRHSNYYWSDGKYLPRQLPGRPRPL